MPDLSTLGTVGAPLIIAVGGVIGLFLKRASDRQAKKDAAAKEIADREAKTAQEKADRDVAERKAIADRDVARAQEVYDQMQEDLATNRAEIRSLQTDLTSARAEMNTMYGQFNQIRLKLEAAESYIAAMHRWADNGAVPELRPKRPEGF